ncbi:MAG: SDR family NAD(P)-dependent oxidoreductase [Lysobacter sp.]|nr:SDR family NAD(P)-dependent oxidoreductase [Lysobacter sp.]
MIDFVEYVVSELRSRRLSKDNALNLIRQFSLGPAAGGARLHPLLHRNASDIHQQCYRSTFDGSEFFLDDHQVAPEGHAPLRVLPGVAYLEMARAAVRDAIPEWAGAGAIRLDDVVWIKPIAVEAPRDVFVALDLIEPAGEGASRVAFEVYTVAMQADGTPEETMHCRGLARMADAGDTAATLDLATLRARMAGGALDADAVYDAYRRMGMRFGPGHRAVAQVLRGGHEALARLVLPAGQVADHGDYVLHPSLLDGALQSAFGLLDPEAGLPDRPSLPFALASVRIDTPCPREAWVWLRHAPDSTPGEKISRLDIDLCDAEGRVCVALRGFASRALAATTGTAAGTPDVAHVADIAGDDTVGDGLMLAEPEWIARATGQGMGDTDARACLLVCGLPSATVDALRTALPGTALHVLPDAQDLALDRAYTDAARATLAVVQAMLREVADAADAPIWLQLMIAGHAQALPMQGLSGLLLTAAREQPRLRVQTLLVDTGCDAGTLARILREERAIADVPPDALVRHVDGTRQVRGWRPLPPAVHGDADGLYRDSGVYLVTGGLGGLGRLFAADILARAGRARVVLTGRAAASADIATALDAIDAGAVATGRLLYRSLDPADAEATHALLAALCAEFGRIDGILHCAGMVDDGLLAQKSADGMARVLAPKVAGTVHLDAASAALDLDFLALFSSGASVLGNVGQGDYAAANGFLDAFAAHRNRLVAEGARRGHTLAVNWPLWAEGGMRMPASQLQAMRAATGMGAMSTANGLAAFQRSLAGGHTQTVAIEGDRARIRAVLFDAPQAPAPAPSSAVATVAVDTVHQADDDLVERTRDYLRRQLSSLFKLPYQKIDPRAPLERYGIDSVLAMDLTSQLEKSFGPLSKTLFFEHQTIDELTAYFVQAHAATLRGLFPATAAATTASAATAAATVQPAPAPLALPASTAGERRRGRRSLAAAAQATHSREPIAIVGLSGRYPESPDLAAFWRNLSEGRDCIVEIPGDRWDWREYYSEDRSAEGAHYSRWGGFIAGVDEFDPLFFNIPPVDAPMIDPQERLFLQHAWGALEDAGITRAGLQVAADPAQAGQVGVYVGVMYGEYQLLGAEASLLGRRIGLPVSYASVANRVSYLLNVHGPSMTLDTMCSSSLTAIHLACQDLRLGRTHAAIAGGVNVSLHPNKYLILSAGQYISTDGHCQSFGVGGDGYIPGEGVGAVVLKRLSDAERDGNHIHGLIRGSALNHGGKTNGYSVPNPRAQSAVIALALREAGVDPRHVSYIEAHGTGTKLGDPIEIAALAQAFRASTQDTGFCAIGSVKSNIGHCESAAGVAGLTKVLLQMRHGQLVPSLHSDTLNPHIDFPATPFEVVQTLRPWTRPMIDGTERPRIAGLSSFGAGGSNAHLVIEEYRAITPRTLPATGRMLLPLSARTPAQLRQRAADLLACLRDGGASIDFGALAWTLRHGREAMDVRLAVVADGVPALIDALAAHLDGASPPSVHTGRVDSDDEALALLAGDDDMAAAVDRWVARGKLEKLAELWVRGYALDWTRLKPDARPALVPLPTYPFERKAYRFDSGAIRRAGVVYAPVGVAVAAPHPLLHRNGSDLYGQRYVSVFDGSETFLSDHRIGDTASARRVLPGVVALEMARGAVDLALPADAPRTLVLRNVAWTQPVVVDAPVTLALELDAVDEATVEFALRSEPVADDAQTHCSGRIEAVAPIDVAPLDLDALRGRMSPGPSPDTLYATFAAMGLHYGPAFRGLVALHRGAGEVLAELAPPHADGDACALPPALLDSALQSALALADAGDASAPAVPFALESLAVHAPCAARMWVWLRESTLPGAELRKFDLDLCDAQGRVCVSIRGLSARRLRLPAAQSLLVARPAWTGALASQPPVVATQRLLLLAGLKAPADIRAQVQVLADIPGAHERYREATLAVLSMLQQLPPGEAASLQVAVADEGDTALLAGLSGLLDTARQERSRLLAQLVLVAPALAADGLAARLHEAEATGATRVRIDADGRLLRREWQDETLDGDAPAPCAFRDEGVYLITGGLGGVGRAFARELLQRTPGAIAVLSGRGADDAARRETLRALADACGVDVARLDYLQLDLGDGEAVGRGIAELVSRHGRLDGVLHAAGETRDALILRKSLGDADAVLAPKVRGTWHLDQATRGIALDWFVLCSSMSAAFGNPGQADYAAANGFMDAFAQHREALRVAGERSGRTRSLLWPLWREGGMHVDADTQRAMTAASGMVPLETASAMRAFHHALAGDDACTIVVEGDAARLRQALRGRDPAPKPAAVAVAPASPADTVGDGDARLLEHARRHLIAEFAGLMGMPEHEVDARAPLEQYGMDSVLAMKLTTQLERSFGTLSRTLFFEYQTIAALAAFLVATYPDRLRSLAGLDAALPTATAPTATTSERSIAFATNASSRTSRRGRAMRIPAAPSPAPAHDAPIAIIGIAGRYPQADDLDAFWGNLVEGRDCIGEVPGDRWHHAALFHPERNRPGTSYSKWGGFVDGVDRFDALFFGISPKEAELIDPQERLFLETAWETFEHAGYAREAVAGRRIGVYVGVMWGQYELYGVGAGAAGAPSSSFASIANRVSYTLDLHGPSLALDTMCSSSLTAIHLACEDLRRGHAEAALAGGVNLSLHPAKYLSLSQGNFASTDGRCRSFGAGGDGYVPGEGVGAVLLKPLDRAIADGDRIHGVIRASAINHGGKTNGYTVPNPVAQGELVAEALQRAGVPADSIGYIETHGTGTSLGDPIEITGLVRAWRAAGAGETDIPCAIGSVKSNIGHLESAAGIAALTKVLLQLRHGRYVPSLHADTLNPHIDFDATPFRVQRTLAEWPRPAMHPRRAGISSFGAGGANAHLVVEAYEDDLPAATRIEPQLFLLSARSREALVAYAARMLAALEAADDARFADIAYTSQVGRTALAERLAIQAADLPALRAQLRAWHDAAQDGRKTAGTGVFEGNARAAGAGALAAIDGEAGEAFLRATLDARALDALAKLWVAGVSVDWTRLHAGVPVRRMPLPTYPFVRERYWIAAPDPVALAVSPGETTGIAAPRPTATTVHARATWDAVASVSAMVAPDGPVLVIGTPAQTAAIADACGVDATCAGMGETDVADAMAQLATAGRMPAAIVVVLPGGDDIEVALAQGLYPLHAACTALLRLRPGASARIVAVAARGDDDSALVHAGLAGYLRSLAQENPRFAWKTLALASFDDGTIAASLAPELRERDWTSGEYRIVDGGRRRRRFEAFAPPKPERDAIRQRGVYLITGGLGGLGLLFATHLATRHAARLVLTGRSPLDARGEATLQALRDSGGDAVYVQADVADATRAQAAVDAARTRFGRIDGVIHAAGVHRDAFAIHKDRDAIAAVLAAKVQGTLHLDAATAQDSLDLFVGFSSVSGAFGNAGQCDYACANAFLDAFAARRAARVARGERHGRSLSIGWPYWLSGGMRLSDDEIRLAAERTGMRPLPDADGVAAWHALLADEVAHAVVVHGDAARIRAALDTPLAAQAARTAPAATPLPVAAAADGALQGRAEDYLKGLLSIEIKLPVERIDAQERFEAYGVDSMMVARINAALERDLGELPKTLFYEYTNIEELAAYLSRDAGAALQRLFAETAGAAEAAQVDAVAFPPAAPQRVVAASSAPPAALSIVAEAEAQPAPTAPTPADGRIAIIGLHVRLPQSPSLNAFWAHLRDGRDLIGPVPMDRWDAEAFHDADPARAADGRIYCRTGGFLDDVDAFDAAFFGIADADADAMDPQERLFLQSAWSAIEDAGYTRDGLRARHPRGRGVDAGVFVGVTTNTYSQLTPEAWRRGRAVNASAMPWSIANRVSYVFDFQGPSLPIDTACSSSLVAIQMACDSLRRGECAIAIAGGVNLYLHPAKYHSLCARGMLAEHGRCRSFGAGDDGFVPGEGVGTLVLKPLAQALADGDHVHGIVAGGAQAHSGRANGYSAPNPVSQAAVISAALADAGIDADAIGYVEGHGTGTQLGDGLELVSLANAFAGRSADAGPCALGSVKANVGHGESVAGIAGVARVLLQLRHRMLAPTLHSEPANPDIDFDATPFRLQQALAPWPAPRDGAPRRAIVNSFGAGGVNACLVLEEAPVAATTASARGPQLFVLSARDGERLHERVDALREALQAWLRDPARAPAADAVAWTLQDGREAMEERLAVVADGLDGLLRELDAWRDGHASQRLVPGRVEPHQRRKANRADIVDALRADWRAGRLDALALQWVQGQDIPWQVLRGDAARPVRVPLPPYPFARTRHWITDAPPPGPPAIIDDSHGRQAVAPLPPALHPLIVRNASTLREIRFESQLDASDWYARDHRVAGTVLFPGAAYIEIAAAAAAIAGEAPVTRVEDVVWAQPLALQGAQPVQTRLVASGEGAEFAIRSFDADMQPQLHAEGRVRYGRGRAAHAAPQVRDIDALLREAPRVRTGEACYAALAAFGFDYGPSFRSIRELHVGDGLAIARLGLDPALRAAFDQYLLHPALIDGALQTVSGMALDAEAGGEGERRPYLPFALEAIERFRPLLPECWAVARRAAAGPAGSGLLRFDLELLSLRGERLVALDGFYVRALPPGASRKPGVPVEAAG